jgi:hypothetical protein
VEKITDNLYHFDEAYQDMREFTKKKLDRK